uniref:Uncharacterized protein n=1 Tax=Glossina austeni TaxID=7395 RepID=A0A1A9UM98_GLOAU
MQEEDQTNERIVKPGNEPKVESKSSSRHNLYEHIRIEIKFFYALSEPLQASLARLSVVGGLVDTYYGLETDQVQCDVCPSIGSSFIWLLDCCHCCCFNVYLMTMINVNITDIGHLRLSKPVHNTIATMQCMLLTVTVEASECLIIEAGVNLFTIFGRIQRIGRILIETEFIAGLGLTSRRWRWWCWCENEETINPARHRMTEQIKA